MGKALAMLIAAVAALVPPSGRDVDGRQRFPTLELHGRRAAVFVFVAVDCPVSNGYAPEIGRLATAYAGRGFDFYRVYADAAVKAADATRHGTAYGLAFPALLDPNASLAGRLGATRTPEVAVVTADGVTVYRGRIDDKYESVGRPRFAATVHDLRDALDAVAAGRAVKVPVTVAVGCPI